jgi:hypothetical protein
VHVRRRDSGWRALYTDGTRSCAKIVGERRDDDGTFTYYKSMPITGFSGFHAFHDEGKINNAAEVLVAVLLPTDVLSTKTCVHHNLYLSMYRSNLTFGGCIVPVILAVKSRSPCVLQGWVSIIP